MAKWRVNEGRQVNVGGVVYEGGATFEATDEQAAPLAAWVTRTKASPAASADGKAQTSSPNKAVTSSPNKSKKK